MKLRPASSKKLLNPKVLISTGLGVVIIASLTTNFKSTFVSKMRNEQSEKLQTSENKVQNFTINTAKDTVLVFETGSVIKISKNSFLDKNGHSINGNVTLHYREFHSVGETLLAGIPMKYDSAGTKYHFESAGMFEILADYHKEPVFLDENSSIQVELVTNNNQPDKFNQYYLENKEKKWQFIEKDNIRAVSPFDSAKPAEIISKTQALIKQLLVKPAIINGKNKQFSIDVQKDQYPELEVFKKIIFEVSSENKSFDLKKTKNKWIDVEIKRIDQSKNYEVTFLGPNEKYQVIAYPVLDTSDYEASMANFKKLNEIYQKKRSIKNQVEAKEVAKRQSQENFYAKSLDNYRSYLRKYENIFSDSMALVNLNQSRYQKLNDIIFRTFQVRNFGIWNSDCPSNLPQGMLLAANFVDENGKQLNPSYIYLVEKGKNAIFTYTDKSKISFNPNAENKFIIISNNTLCYVSNETFELINKEDKNFVFKVKTIKKDSYTSEDINSLI